MANDSIPELPSYDESSLDAAFSALNQEVSEDARLIKTAEEREAFRLRWQGRKQGRLKLISEAWVNQAPLEARKPLGIRFNALKEKIATEMRSSVVGLDPVKNIDGMETPVRSGIMDMPQGAEYLLGRIRESRTAEIIARTRPLDITLPGIARAPGIPHPLLTTMDRVVQVFHQLGYSTSLGPQVESDFFNFEALNFPENHPARDTQDTLQIAAQSNRPSRDRLLMRTHTSPVQIRTMLTQAPPLRIVIPGKVHRNDAADATHSPIFHQVEGLCVDRNITFSDLKGTLDHAMRALFGSAVKTRFFPSFFPFTEPSADVQISCIFCGGPGCRKCKQSGWIELLGCGMVDPAVFEAVTEERRRLHLDPTPYDPSHISGFAFGMGVERIAMILHEVSDIGNFYSGDLRFLEQFA